MVARPKSRLRLHGRRIGENDILDIRDEREPVVLPGLDQPNVTSRDQLRESRFFGSPAFRRLWFSQVCSSLGDWIGLVAISFIAADITGGGNAEKSGAVSLVLAARLIPGVFLSPFVGAMLDRFNRKHIMVISDVVRAVVLCLVPFVDSLIALVLVSFVLEMFTLLYSPAKEASVPNLVKPSFLPTANSLSLIAAWGMALPAAAFSAVLVKVPEWIGQGDLLQSLGVTHSTQAVLLYFDAFTYLISAAVIATLALGHTKRDAKTDGTPSTGSWAETKAGLLFVVRSRQVRAVIFGMSAALIGGAMVVPLGAVFATDVLQAGGGGYGLLLTAIGAGLAIGLIGLWVMQKRIIVEKAFGLAITGAGLSLLVAATMSGLGAAAIAVGMLGLCAGAAYALGYTSLQVNVEDELRGRVFTVLYTLTRVGVVAALAAAPALALAFGRLSDALVSGSVSLGSATMMLPGVRLTLWFGAIIMIVAGVFATRSLKQTVAVERG